MTLSLYPTAYDTFETKVDYTTRILAAHVNKLQDVTYAIEHDLGLGISGNYDTLEERISKSIDDNGNIAYQYTNAMARDLVIAEVVNFSPIGTLNIVASGGYDNANLAGVVSDTTIVAGELGYIIQNGIGAVKIIAENGDINIGDFLTTASVEGYATSVLDTTVERTIGRSSAYIPSGTSGIYNIVIDIEKYQVPTHTHLSNETGGLLGYGAVNSTNVLQDDSYTVRDLTITGNFATVGSTTISGDLIVLGSEYITNTEVVSGNTVMAGNLEIYGNSYLGNQSTDLTYVFGELFISELDPLTATNSDGQISLGINAGNFEYLNYSYVSDEFYLSSPLVVEGSIETVAAEFIVADIGTLEVDNLGATTATISGALTANDFGTEVITFTEISSADVSTPSAGDFKLFTQEKGMFAKDSDGNLISFNPSEDIGGCVRGVLGETIASGQPSYQNLTDNKWYKAQAIDGMVTLLSFCKVGGSVDENGLFSRYDTIEGLSGLPDSAELYLSQATAGGVTSTIPSSGIIAFLGITKGTTIIDAAIALIAYDTSTADASGSIIGEPWTRGTGLVELSNPTDDVLIQGNLQVDGQTYFPTTVDAAAIGSFNINLNSSNNHAIVLDGAGALTMQNAQDGGNYCITVTNSVSGNTLSFSPTVVWSGGVSYTPTSTINSLDLIYIDYINSAYYGHFYSDFS